MHPPLYKPHPLCKKEVEDLVRCHEENPFMKFLNACGDVKITLDRCFREEKKLRVKLNKRHGDAASPVMVFDHRDARSSAAAPASDAPAATTGEPLAK